MKKIQYQVLRYIPDRVTGEFVNLGIVAFDQKERTLAGKFINKIGNISAFFPQVNSRYLIKSVKSVKDMVDLFALQLQSELKFNSDVNLESITQNILPKDDTSLIFSEIKLTLDINVAACVNDFFVRLVKAHLLEEDDDLRHDREVWNKVYKRHFDENGITTYFHEHTVKTKNDELQFDRAWKNGAWNCFEPISFNLSRPDAIKNKVYKWVGKLDELNSSKEPLHIYLLSVLPNDYPELTSFITKKIKAKSTEKIKIDLVSEINIEMIAKKIKKEIESYSK